MPQAAPTSLDHPREHCGVFAIWGDQHPARQAYLGLFTLQHRGQESAGIAVTDRTTLHRRGGMGLVSAVFDAETLDELDRLALANADQVGAIGHNRYSTTGLSAADNIQPFIGHFAGGPVAIAHNGNITNARLLRGELESHGRAFFSSSDTEVVLQLLAASEQADPLADALSRLEGAFSLAFLFNDRVELARDPFGWRPLVVGRFPSGVYVAASETVSLDAIGATTIREVEPGEIVTLSERGLETRRFAPADRPTAHCVFEHVYFASPASKVFGSTVQTVRERFGERLAAESPVDADLVAPMPDSGRSAATGYARASHIPYREAIIPNRYVGRTFIKPTGDERAAAVRAKLNIVSDIVSGQRVIVVDDSIVRGTTTRLKMDQLRAAGAREIHLRISCPPIKHPCFFGVDFPDRDQLVAHNRSVDDIAQLLGVDSLAFLSLEGLLEVVGTPEVPSSRYCHACFSGSYPITIEGERRKDALLKNC